MEDNATLPYPAPVTLFGSHSHRPQVCEHLAVRHIYKHTWIHTNIHGHWTSFIRHTVSQSTESEVTAVIRHKYDNKDTEWICKR